MRNKEWLLNKRNEYGITQRELASGIGLTSFSIENIEQGKRKGSDDTWIKIEEYFTVKDSIKNHKIDENSVCRITINENSTLRGKNSLFYQVEIDDLKGNRIRTISYQKNAIAKMLHESPIFSFFKETNGKLINTNQVLEKWNLLENTIRLLDQIDKIY